MLARQVRGGVVQDRAVGVAQDVHPPGRVGHMHADRVGVGVDADQQRRHRAARAVQRAHGLIELVQPLQ